MGFLDNTSITVDAILTKTGRERLSQGAFQITKFSLSDEEVDYSLYDTTHPNGTDSYGAVIENMNLLEAHPSRTGFHSHLINQSVAGGKIMSIDASYTRDAFEIIPLNPSTDIIDENYTFTIVGQTGLGVVRFQSAPNNRTVTGKSVKLVAQDFSVPSTNNSVSVTISGIQSGAVKNTTIVVNANLGSQKDSNSPVVTLPENDPILKKQAEANQKKIDILKVGK
tara:strand:- start:583 stop:1254 length:672 start_codon:yes stop_codon:yes gene_type:complete